MKANELRIRNVVNFSNKKWQIVSIHADGSIRIMKENEFPQDIHVNFVVPIPLTEEWLLKFGFDKIRVREYEKGDMSIYCGKKTISINVGFCNECGGYEIKVEIKYVHQLQNLYFALTGEELKLNETKP